MKVSVIILAAGKGQRMRSQKPKVLHQVGGVPMLERVVSTAKALEPEKIYVVYGNGGQQVRQQMSHLNVEWVEQNQRLGTGHAVLQVIDHIPDEHMVLVLYGDVPLVRVETLQQLCHKTPKQGVGVVVACLDDPTGFGRIVRNEMNHITAIVEHKDATSTERKIREINTGIMMVQAHLLRSWLPQLSQQNAQGEYYLTDIIDLAVTDGHSVGGVMAHSHTEVMGVNNRYQLSQVERAYQKIQAQHLMTQGITLLDPERFDLRGTLQAPDGDVCIDVNVVILGDNVLAANTSIGSGTVLENARLSENVRIGAACVVRNTTLAEGSVVHDHSIIDGAVIANRVSVGPFARVRPGTELAEGVKIGNFVEIKNSVVGAGSKASHLSYIGDAQLGRSVNIGASTVTCNYDGDQKHQTVIHDGAHVGAHSSLVAPVVVGEQATLGAGTVLVSNAPEHQLTLSRSSQTTIESWVRPSDRPAKEKK